MITRRGFHPPGAVAGAGIEGTVLPVAGQQRASAGSNGTLFRVPDLFCASARRKLREVLTMNTGFVRPEVNSWYNCSVLIVPVRNPRPSEQQRQILQPFWVESAEISFAGPKQARVSVLQRGNRVNVMGAFQRLR